MTTTKRAKPGPRPRFGTPISGTGITAPPEDLIFLMLNAPDGKTSVGARNIIRKLIELDADAPPLMQQAQWMARRAEELLLEGGEEVTQKAVYRYVADHYLRLIAGWQELQATQPVE